MLQVLHGNGLQLCRVMLLLGVAEVLDNVLSTGRMEVGAATLTQLLIQGLLVTGKMEVLLLAAVVTVQMHQVVLEVLGAVVLRGRVALVLLAVVLRVLFRVAVAVSAAKMTHTTAETVDLADMGMLLAVAVVVEIPRMLWKMLAAAVVAVAVVQTHPTLRFQAQG